MVGKIPILFTCAIKQKPCNSNGYRVFQLSKVNKTYFAIGIFPSAGYFLRRYLEGLAGSGGAWSRRSWSGSTGGSEQARYQGGSGKTATPSQAGYRVYSPSPLWHPSDTLTKHNNSTQQLKLISLTSLVVEFLNSLCYPLKTQ